MARGAECPGGHLEPKGPPRGQEGVKQPGECRMTRSAPNYEWPERLQTAWIVPISQERASPSGQGALQRVWSGGGYQGLCCVKISVSGHHSITKQASFVVKREQRTFWCSTSRFPDVLSCNLSGALLGAPSKKKYVAMACIASSGYAPPCGWRISCRFLMS